MRRAYRGRRCLRNACRHTPPSPPLGQTPRKKVAATAGILHQIRVPILRALRDRALLLVGFTDALRPPDLAPNHTERCPGHTLSARPGAGRTTAGQVSSASGSRRRPERGRSLPCPASGLGPTPWIVGSIVKERAVATGLAERKFGVRSLKRGPLSTSKDHG